MGIKAKTQITQHQVHYQKTPQQHHHNHHNQEMLINNFKEASFNAQQNLNKKHGNGYLNEHKNLGECYY